MYNPTRWNFYGLLVAYDDAAAALGTNTYDTNETKMILGGCLTAKSETVPQFQDCAE